ncbi:MAG: SGNH/GDSL hydrolase family protein [Mycoplasmatales bacterium]
MKVIDKLKFGMPVTIVCLGDSITFGYKPNAKGVEQVEIPYPAMLEKLLRKKYNYNDIVVINSGVPGWQIGQALKNFDSKVLDFKPDMCIIMYGINDARGSLKGGLPLLKSMYELKYKIVLDKLLENEIQPLLLTSTYAHAWRLEEFVCIVKKIACDYQVPVVNNYEGVIKLVEELKISMKVAIPDKIHLRDDLYKYIAINIIEQEF